MQKKRFVTKTMLVYKYKIYINILRNKKFNFSSFLDLYSFNKNKFNLKNLIFCQNSSIVNNQFKMLAVARPTYNFYFDCYKYNKQHSLLSLSLQTKFISYYVQYINTRRLKAFKPKLCLKNSRFHGTIKLHLSLKKTVYLKQ